MWTVVTVERFDEWFLTLDESEQQSILTGVFKLEQFGPMLGRPDADTLAGNKKVKNLLV